MLFLSWPRLSRPSTSCLRQRWERVDASMSLRGAQRRASVRLVRDVSLDLRFAAMRHVFRRGRPDRALFSRWRPIPARWAIDDAAILKGSADDLVVTTDAIVEGVHFLPDDPPDTIARKALRVNLSDLAAKGAAPAGFVLTLALREVNDSWLAPFARALGEDATALCVSVARRRHGVDAGAADDLDHRVRPRSGRADGAAKRGARRRRGGRHRHHRRRDARACRCSSRGRQRDAGGAEGARRALPRAAAARRPRRRRCATMPARRWTCRTGLPAIWPSFARPQACPLRSSLSEFRCRRRRGCCWPRGRRRSRR